MRVVNQGVVITLMLIAIATTITPGTGLHVQAVERQFVTQVDQYEALPRQSLFGFGEKPFPNEQKLQKQAVQRLNQVPMECEGAAARLDFAVIETEKLEGTYLIIVARLGTSEVSIGLNHIRLAVAEEYVRRRGSDLKYVLAQGERVKGLGRLELYVGGRLKDVLPLKKNAKGYCVPGRGWS